MTRAHRTQTSTVTIIIILTESSLRDDALSVVSPGLAMIVVAILVAACSSGEIGAATIVTRFGNRLAFSRSRPLPAHSP